MAGARVLDGLVHGEDEAGRLGRCRQSVDLDYRRLPHARLEVVTDVLCGHIDTKPFAVYKGIRVRLIMETYKLYWT